MRYTVDADSGGDYYRWRLIGDTNRRIATSADWFYSEAQARASAGRFKSRCSSWNYEVYGDLLGIYRWRAKSSDNQIIALSANSFPTQFSARTSASDVRARGAGADGP